MAMIDKVFDFLNSKWFSLVLGIALIAVLPSTYHNFMVVYGKGQLSEFWWVILVFIINILSVGLCAYKFMQKMTAPKIQAAEAW